MLQVAEKRAEYVCDVQELPARPIIYVKRVTAVEHLPQVMDSVYNELDGHATAHGVCAEGPAFVIYHNMDMHALDLEIGIFIDREVPAEGEMQYGQFPVGRWAVTQHTGPYQGLAAAYGALETWVEAQGFTPAGVACEFYLNDPAEVPPESYHTQVMFLLK